MSAAVWAVAAIGTGIEFCDQATMLYTMLAPVVNVRAVRQPLLILRTTDPCMMPRGKELRCSNDPSGSSWVPAPSTAYRRPSARGVGALQS